MGQDAASGGIAYLIDAVDRQPDLPRRAPYVTLMRELAIDAPHAARELTPEEETAIGVVLGAVQLALADEDYGGLMRAVAVGVQLGMRFALRTAAEQS